MKIHVKSLTELKTKKWISPPGEPGMSFQCSQAMKSERLAYLDEAKLVVHEGGHVLQSESGKIVEAFSRERLYNGTMQLILAHVHNWKGSDIVDTAGKELKYTRENMEALIIGCGDEKIKLQDGTEEDLMTWLSDSICDPKTFTKGDQKN